jgi:branched-chain amino acid transport system ATP-binding protein
MSVSDKIIVLNLGEKIAEGSPEDVASNDRVQKVYLGTP